MDASGTLVFPPSESADQEMNTNSWRRRGTAADVGQRGQIYIHICRFYLFIFFYAENIQVPHTNIQL